MDFWKKRLYEHYVSSGQASNSKHEVKHDLATANHLLYMLNKHIPNNKDLNILDIGCGHGGLIFCLQKLGYNNIHGIDISEEQVKLAHDLGVDNVECADVSDFLIGKNAEYDVIFLMDVLEHLTKQEMFDYLDLINASLKENGLLILHVPNGEGLFGMRIRYGDLTHENAFTSQSIKQILNVTNFRDIGCFEDSPPIHGIKSLIRYLLWVVLTFRFRLLLLAETGTYGHLLSQNILVKCLKA